ncbi:MAG: flagellar export chaperone FlgN [Oscillospiraceae bacterium]
MTINETQAQAVIRCLEIDVDFYRELTVFLMKKHNKILEDDLDWLTESLNKEQAYVMKSRSLEDKRISLFEGLGLGGMKLSKITENAPGEYRPKIKMLSGQLTELIDGIKSLNAETNEVVKRKLDNQREFVKRAGILEKPETYNRNASRVAGGQSSAKAFREV